MASLVRMDPAREMMSLREAMDRLFEESFLRPGLLGGGESAAGMLPIDVYETENAVFVKAAVPGIKPEDIDVTLTGDLLTIKGEFKAEQKEEKRNYLRQERRFGSFSRQLTLPVSVDADKCKASFEDGLLTLELPKVEQAKAKSIKVTAK
ncbi:MAG: Spore protein SP21 [Chloroflexi bacterium ADurb.Bin325]|nr:MAG: Spore protein SP21 [Chloroflexi bacterium ADurb.Bin325]